MDKNFTHRRSLIARSLTLLGSIFFLGAIRSSFGATAPNTTQSDKKTGRARKGQGMKKHCIEGEQLRLPVQD
jgi:hypothetical protein